ncbi:MAG TPA: M67 family metallopeptidase [Anaerolineales bacterium]|nr:M67 family metallopeptidase [Anaerolineales bacterium]
MRRQLILSKDQWQQMLHHVDRQAPLEACGLLAGKQDQVEKVLLVQNQAQSPVRFVMDPYEQLQAFDWIESNGLDLLGIFHSHPAGPETASATDIAEAAYEVVHLIWSRDQSRWQARGFWLENGNATAVELKVVR